MPRSRPVPLPQQGSQTPQHQLLHTQRSLQPTLLPQSVASLDNMQSAILMVLLLKNPSLAHVLIAQQHGLQQLLQWQAAQQQLVHQQLLQHLVQAQLAQSQSVQQLMASLQPKQHDMQQQQLAEGRHQSIASMPASGMHPRAASDTPMLSGELSSVTVQSAQLRSRKPSCALQARALISTSQYWQVTIFGVLMFAFELMFVIESNNACQASAVLEACYCSGMLQWSTSGNLLCSPSRLHACSFMGCDRLISARSRC